ncbi:hypothetical protein [uncultured Roseibium sp.]|uniref:hypothetical protein n=1 Tax=uncultured Roseibium sp. TaxID=1936171 RepID=UPI00261D1CF4|nr:hypothetical protein [uncultured Roseibium sp.]
MQVVTLDQIRSTIGMHDAIEAVRQSFIDVANGRIIQPEPMQILFHDGTGALVGDCHAKAAQAEDRPYFTIKIATGFYRNPQRGLPTNDGMVLVLSSSTGRPVALLQDEGWLTQMRTAAAGALAASLKAADSSSSLGIVGTGTQARLQALAVRETTGLNRLHVLGRHKDRVEGYIKDMEQLGFSVTAAANAKSLCENSEIVVTTTPSTSAVLHAADLKYPLHVIGVGADSPGKTELAPDLFGHADIIATDSHAQCLQHGDFGVAVRAGIVEETADRSFGDILAGMAQDLDFADARLSIVDLTGLGAQDLAVASAVVSKLNLI